MNIITSYFLVKRVAGSVFIGEASLRHRTVRQQEYLDCIRRNAEHTEVESLHILIEGPHAYSHFRDHVMHDNNFFTSPTLRRKIIPVLCSETQPTYADMFQHANRLLRGRLAMICNADVYLPQQGAPVAALQRLFAPPREGVRVAVALTRYESEKWSHAPLIHDYRGSHDAFVLRPPLQQTFIDSVRHPQNCYKAENVVLHELQRHGYTVVNPCLSFMLVHKHEAELRQWLPPVDEERYARAPPCTITEAMDVIKRGK